MSRIKECNYDSILISDHTPNSLSYVDPGLKKDPPKWRLQQKWLRDPDLISFLEAQTDLYFTVNTSETTASTRWEAFKAFIRGQIINFTSSKSKKAKQKLTMLESKIKILEIQYYQMNIN